MKARRWTQAELVQMDRGEFRWLGIVLSSLDHNFAWGVMGLQVGARPDRWEISEDVKDGTILLEWERK